MDGLLIVNEQHLRRALTEYQKHYNAARPHRSLGQLTPAQADTRPPEPIDLADHRVRRNQVLSGLTHEYYVAALPTLLLKSRSPVRIVFPSPTAAIAELQTHPFWAALAAWMPHAMDRVQRLSAIGGATSG